MHRSTLGFGAVVVIASASQACATQGDAFRHMSAEAHEQVANQATSGGDLGATPNDHLMAAARLRAAELSACAGVPESDRDEGPLARRNQIEDVETLHDRIHTKAMLQPSGVAVYLRATPGLTEQWLGRVLLCHLA
ncbi:MAG TPA: hypothetical protein VKU41_03530, partial [Polyangiaceae bacterium]|nr:hypothetical protein [Polyangiaceae bacterium]